MNETLPTEVIAPRGSKPGDIPSGIIWPRKVWLILPDSASSSQSESIRRARAELEKNTSITVSETKIRKVRGVNGFSYPLLPAGDVAAIYRGSHRARTAVVAFCGAKILLDNSELPTNKGCISLEKFASHKCRYLLVTRPSEIATALDEVISWMDLVNCDGPSDPRCLPTAIFETDQEYTLDSPESRKKFIDAHTSTKKGKVLADSQGRSWEIGPNHTLDLLQVGGRTLPIGFHWDVQAGSRNSKIASGWETWHLPRGNYINIHPDAYIRGDGARKTHSALKDTSKAPRVPRSKRKKAK